MAFWCKVFGHSRPIVRYDMETGRVVRVRCRRCGRSTPPPHSSFYGTLTAKLAGLEVYVLVMTSGDCLVSLVPCPKDVAERMPFLQWDPAPLWPAGRHRTAVGWCRVGPDELEHTFAGIRRTLDECLRRRIQGNAVLNLMD